MKKKNMTINMFYVPAICLFLFFVIYPLFKGVFLSFTNWNGYSQNYRIIGLKNFERLFTDKNVGRAFLNTLFYGCGSTIIQNILGLGFALLLNQQFRGRSVVRTVIYMPVLISQLIMGYIMYFFFTYENGALNDVTALFGMAPLDWLGSGNRAVFIIMLVNSLQFCGVAMVIYLAGLQGIPDMYYEAASMDGCKPWMKFTHITLPMLAPAINSSVTINIIGGLKLFDVIQALTQGGPGYDSHSLSSLVHRTYFGSENAGYASAIGLLSFVVIMVISLLLTAYMDKKEVEL